ncbi:MAG: hypothetical protein GVY07_10745 [Bacteroidetes bacterium]|jgi:hypothetical protein|nr:hypothetical protein [Bacteroidota bacterium]
MIRWTFILILGLPLASCTTSSEPEPEPPAPEPAPVNVNINPPGVLYIGMDTGDWKASYEAEDRLKKSNSTTKHQKEKTTSK